MSGDLSEEIAALVKDAGRVAVDTETTGLDWRTDSLKLCQLCAPTVGPVIIQITGLAPHLRALLEDPSVTKVFHFAPFDLRFLEAALGARTTTVMCTKAGSKLLNPELPSSGHSLSALLHRHFGISLDKGAVRTSDWGSAQLTEAQTDYATGDVVSLLRLVDAEMELLQSRDLVDEFAAICAYMPVDAHLEVTGIPNPLAY